jgi:predicted P-loop ATPase
MNIKDNKYLVSTFKNVLSNKVIKDVTIIDVLNDVFNGTYKNEILHARSLEAKDYDLLKKTLPCFTASGTFTDTRKIANLSHHSNLLQIDIDFKDNQNVNPNAWGAITQLKACYSFFISPSGKGYKALFVIDGNFHNQYFLYYETYFKTELGIIIDKACKDVSRLFIYSYDPNLYINYNAVAEILPVNINTGSSNLKSEVLQVPKMPGVDLLNSKKEYAPNNIEIVKDKYFRTHAECWEFAKTKMPTNGNTNNNFLHCFACYCNRSGFDEIETLQYALDNHRTDTPQQITSTVNSAYKNNVAEHGKYKFQELNKIEVPALEVNNKVENDNQNLPKITIIENFLNKNFDFRFNKIKAITEYKNKDNSNDWQEVNENSISRFLQKNYHSYSPTNTGSLLYSDFVKEFNPIKEYFDNLTLWDKTTEPDYIKLLASYIDTTNNERFTKHLYKMLIRCIECSTFEGKTNTKFNKHVFVLMSDKQSLGKSYFCEWLCPEELKTYYSSDFTFDKDGSIDLSSMFIINLDELASMYKSESAKLKTIISTQSTNKRLPYGKRSSVRPRIANFFGSTNENEFLTDTTGNVRWLAFALNDINKAYSKDIDVKNIWRQANTYFKNGISGKLTDLELQENEIENKKFQINTTEDDLILTYLKTDTSKNENNFKTTTEISLFFTNQLGNSLRINNNILGRKLKQHGFVQEQKRIGSNNPKKGYYVMFLMPELEK